MKTKTNNSYSVFLFVGVLLIGCAENNKKDENFNAILNSYVELIEANYIDSAITLTEEMKIIHPKNYQIYSVLGQAYAKKGMDSIAKINYRLALRLNELDNKSLTGYAIILDKSHQYIEAKDYYDRALKINPVFYPTISNYAFNRLQAEDYKNAVSYGEQALSLQDNTPDKAILCVAYHKSGMYKKRDSLFERLSDMNYKFTKELKETISSPVSRND